MNEVIQFSAVPVVALVAWRLVPLRPWGIDGWRWVVLLGSVGAIFVWFIRQRIPESPRWLIAHGKLDEAERMTARNGTARQQRKADPRSRRPKLNRRRNSTEAFLEIFGPSYGPRTFMLMVFHFFQTIGYYGFASWVPTLLIANGIGITSSLQYSFHHCHLFPVRPAPGAERRRSIRKEMANRRQRNSDRRIRRAFCPPAQSRFG